MSSIFNSLCARHCFQWHPAGQGQARQDVAVLQIAHREAQTCLLRRTVHAHLGTRDLVKNWSAGGPGVEQAFHASAVSYSDRRLSREPTSGCGPLTVLVGHRMSTSNLWHPYPTFPPHPSPCSPPPPVLILGRGRCRPTDLGSPFATTTALHQGGYPLHRSFAIPFRQADRLIAPFGSLSHACLVGTREACPPPWRFSWRKVPSTAPSTELGKGQHVVVAVRALKTRPRVACISSTPSKLVA